MPTLPSSLPRPEWQLQIEAGRSAGFSAASWLRSLPFMCSQVKCELCRYRSPGQAAVWKGCRGPGGQGPGEATTPRPLQGSDRGALRFQARFPARPGLGSQAVVLASSFRRCVRNMQSLLLFSHLTVSPSPSTICVAISLLKDQCTSLDLKSGWGSSYFIQEAFFGKV